jgi:YVTN family beta-propeller protein
MQRIATLVAILVVVAGVASLRSPAPLRAAGPADFTHFESSHVHPIAMTPDGSRVLVVNTPDNRLGVFDVTGATPVRVGEVPVGLEPVSVAARSNTEVWVVNFLSDDVSVVDLTTLVVKATIHAGDEPADVVFANGLAWVSVSNEDCIKIFDPASLATAPQVVPIAARMPRALAVKPNGSSVFVAVFNSNHQTTCLSEAEAGDSLPPPDPPMKAGLPAAPKVGLIVRKNSLGNWLDGSGKIWNSKVPYELQLVEFLEISTASHAVVHNYNDIAVIMMGAAYDPVHDVAAVSGTYALNDVRFEPKLAGHTTEARLALCRSDGTRFRALVNPQIDYDVATGPQSERDSALGIPSGVTFSPDGNRVYLTSLATDKLGVFDAASGNVLARVATVAGPTGVLADPSRPRIYVVGRFRNQLQTLSSGTLASLSVSSIGFDPTPDDIVDGRRFFYSGAMSGHGEEACASCHLFGDTDHLGWDLGNPLGDMQAAPPGQIDPLLQGFHPMKGPTMTQSLRGLPGTGLLHWRGDRADLNAFKPAFQSLLGKSTPIADSEMTALGNFVMALVYPPNPNQNLDRSMPDAPTGQPSALRGQQFFLNTPVDGSLRCVDCHAMPTGTNGQVIDHTALREAQDMKVPQLRNMYKKSGFRDSTGVLNKKGFGFTHNGSVDNLFDFLQFPGFNFGANATVANATRRDLEAFLLAFDTGLAPAVGAQLTFDGTNTSDAALLARLETLKTQAASGNCDLIAKGRTPQLARGWLYLGGDVWKSDEQNEPTWTTARLLALAQPGYELTITGAPPGTGTRMGIDRDRDGWLDADELLGGGDPANPAVVPSVLAVPSQPALEFALRALRPNPFGATATATFTLGRAGRIDLDVRDVLGRRVRSVAHAMWLTAGPHSIAWDGTRDDGSNAPAGVYFVSLETAGGTFGRTLICVR